MSSFESNKNWTLPDEVELLADLRGDDEAYLDRLVPKVAYTAPVSTPSTSSAPETTQDPFMTALMNEPDARTTNNDLAFKATGHPLVDLFYELAPHADFNHLSALLDSAWSKDPQSTLKIILHARSIHEGKGLEGHVFYNCVGWLFANHPRTLLENLALLVEPLCSRPDVKFTNKESQEEFEARAALPHACWKDLLDILQLAIMGKLGTQVDDKTLKNSISNPSTAKLYKEARTTQKPKYKFIARYNGQLLDADGDFRSKYMAAKGTDKHQLVADRLQNALKQNKTRALFIRIARLFASQLKRDLSILHESSATTTPEGKNALLAQLTYAAKWAPSPSRAHDKQTFMATAISQILFADLAEATKARVALQQTYLAPLRKTLALPEVAIAARQWSSINYERVSSRAMSRYKVQFFLRDTSRFSAYIKAVSKGQKKISGTTMMPHELLHQAVSSYNGKGTGPDIYELERANPERAKELRALLSETSNAQWKSMVQAVAETASEGLSNCMAVCDVSGSMGDLGMDGKNPSPLLVAIALSILLAQLSKAPWSNAFITFSSSPQIVRLKAGSSLAEIAMGMTIAAWDATTNFRSVFLDLILPMAIKNKLKPEDMISKIFVFSDMQFDAANRHEHRSSTGPIWNETAHREISRKFSEAGYTIPALVYWNLADRTHGAVPVQADQPGVELMSGYSASLMKSFLRSGDVEAEDDDAAEGEDEYDDADAPLPTRAPAKEDKSATPLGKLEKTLANPVFSGVVVAD